MIEEIVYTPEEAAQVCARIEKYPVSIAIRQGSKRSLEQNALYQRWVRDIAEQSGYTEDEVRFECKVKWGIPILQRDSEEDRHDYQLFLDRLDAIERDEAVRIMERLVRVTPNMTVAQMSEYLDDIHSHFSKFFMLTDPERVK